MSVDAPSPGGEQFKRQQPTPNVSLGLPRTARLLRHSDFERVYKQGRRHFSAHLTVFYLARERFASRESAQDDGLARIGFTVGRALGGAVERNRIKRRLREAVRLRRSAIRQALDIVINPKKSVLTAEFAVILEEIGRAFDVIEQKSEMRSGDSKTRSGNKNPEQK